MPLSLGSSLAPLGRLIQGSLTPYRWRLLAAVAAVAAAVGATALLPFLGARLATVIIDGQGAGATILASAAVLIGFGVRGGALYGQAVLTHDIMRKVTSTLQQRLTVRAVGDRTTTTSPPTRADTAAAMIGDIDLLHQLVTTAAGSLGVHSLCLAVLVAALLVLDWGLALGIVIGSVAATAAMLWLTQRARQAANRAEASTNALTAHAQRLADGAHHVIANGAERQEAEIADDLIARAGRLTQRTAHLRSLLPAAIETFTGLAIIAVALYGGAQLADDNRAFGDLVGVLIALVLGWSSVRRLAGLGSVIPPGLDAIARLNALLGQDTDGDIAANRPRQEPVSGHIGFSEVSVTCRDTGSALHDVSLTVPAKTRLALVGPPGSGSETVIDLILRVCTPDEGAILIDGNDICVMAPGSLSPHIALVRADAILIDDTVRANIAYGLSGTSDEAIEKAAKAAGADGFIGELPRGYDTLVGRLGHFLSDSERLTLGLARAILRDPPILLVDIAYNRGDGGQAVPGVDSASTDSWLAALDRFASGRTTIVRTDRLLDLRPVDRIAVFDAGHLVEVGTHIQLMAEGGLYARLWQLQETRHAFRADGP